MIRLRRTLERAQRHRWLWILVLVLIAIVVALVALHSTHDAAGVDGPLVCMAVMLLLVVPVRVPRPPTVVLARRVRSRAPPSQLRPNCRRPRLSDPAFLLRL